MEWLILGMFSISLLICIGFGVSILYALAFGLFLFLIYGRHRGFSWRELIRMALEGIGAVKNILITFLLIGILTAFWRASGTIAVIVCYASGLIRPSVFLLMTFLLNSAVSVLTGTAFGTAATMGVICAAMGSSMGVGPVWTGGAVLSGAYFGDRCSPVSTSALLIAALTETDIYHNLRRMLRSALVPFLLTCAAYLAIGTRAAGTGQAKDPVGVFSREFTLHWLALLPAVVILALSACRVNVKLSMASSIASAIPLCLLLQHVPAAALLKAAVLGYTPRNAEVAAIVSGGGIISMCRVAGIVCISSSYSCLFQKTGLLNGAKRRIASLEQKTTSFIATLVTAVTAGMIACNQTLTILLTHQLRLDASAEAGRLALDLEDSAVVVAPLIPWSIACNVPLSAVGAPLSAIVAAFFLYLLPVWRGLTSRR